MKKLTKEEVVATPVGSNRKSKNYDLYSMLYELEIGEGLQVEREKIEDSRPANMIGQYFRRRRMPNRFSVNRTVDNKFFIIERIF